MTVCLSESCPVLLTWPSVYLRAVLHFWQLHGICHVRESEKVTGKRFSSLFIIIFYLHCSSYLHKVLQYERIICNRFTANILVTMPPKPTLITPPPYFIQKGRAKVSHAHITHGEYSTHSHNTSTSWTILYNVHRREFMEIATISVAWIIINCARMSSYFYLLHH